jgi:ribosomal subunit interface protein
MNVGITARHCEITDTVRERAEKRLQTLATFAPKATAADVIFDLDHGVSRVEVKLLGGHTTVAHGSGDNHKAALDAALDRLTTQLKRRHEQRITRRKAATEAEVVAE